MAVSPFDSALLGPLFSDAEVAAHFSDAAEIAAMVAVERALARAEGASGVIPPEAAAAIDAGLDGFAPDPASLAAGTVSAGVPVPALVAALRKPLAPQAAQWLHWGATSQDIVDTALALRLKPVLALLDARLATLATTLADAARLWRDLPMAGRTRSQVAAPITFGLRVAHWRQPLPTLRADLARLTPRLTRVQLGGAVGSNAAIAPHGPAVTTALAATLGLAAAPGLAHRPQRLRRPRRLVRGADRRPRQDGRRPRPDGPQRKRRGARRRRRWLLDDAAEIEPGRRRDHRRPRPARRLR